jgi:hypothetical protein
VTLLARETLPPISLSPALLRWSSARTLFPLFAPLAPAPGETADSRVSSGPGPEVLVSPAPVRAECSPATIVDEIRQDASRTHKPANSIQLASDQYESDNFTHAKHNFDGHRCVSHLGIFIAFTIWCYRV